MTTYATVSIPKRLADDIRALIDESGYWTSIGSFVRDAAIDKLYKERVRWEAVREVNSQDENHR